MHQVSRPGLTAHAVAGQLERGVRLHCACASGARGTGRTKRARRGTKHAWVWRPWGLAEEARAQARPEHWIGSPSAGPAAQTALVPRLGKEPARASSQGYEGDVPLRDRWRRDRQSQQARTVEARCPGSRDCCQGYWDDHEDRQVACLYTPYCRPDEQQVLHWAIRLEEGALVQPNVGANRRDAAGRAARAAHDEPERCAGGVACCGASG